MRKIASGLAMICLLPWLGVALLTVATVVIGGATVSQLWVISILLGFVGFFPAMFFAMLADGPDTVSKPLVMDEDGQNDLGYSHGQSRQSL
jgi:hypothetical protein